MLSMSPAAISRTIATISGGILAGSIGGGGGP
jgi:hypothetical protein